jgi:hypothetical protein
MKLHVRTALSAIEAAQDRDIPALVRDERTKQ